MKVTKTTKVSLCMLSVILFISGVLPHVSAQAGNNAFDNSRLSKISGGAFKKEANGVILDSTGMSRSYADLQPGETAGYLATYTAQYEYNMGVEHAEFPAVDYGGRYTDTIRTDVMYYGLSKDGNVFEGLNNNKAILSPEGLHQMQAPSLFRRHDGTYGLISSVKSITDMTAKIIIYESEDLIFFENQKVVNLNNDDITVKNPTVKYNDETFLYEIYWEGGDGNSYLSTTNDFNSFSDPIAVNYTKNPVMGTFPEYAKEVSVFELTAEEYERVEKKYGEIHSVTVNGTDQRMVAAGTKVSLPEKLEVEYNDGSTKNMGVTWDVDAVDLDPANPKAGEYMVQGKVNRTVYNSPLAECRADPYVAYNEEDGMYYFTSSYMQPNKQNAYDRIIIRKASTINGVTDAQEFTIWDNKSDSYTKPWYWAPELHYIGGKWRVIALSTVQNHPIRDGWAMTILTCEGDDLTDRTNWELTGYVNAAKDGRWPGAFDTTFFEYDGQCYYVTPTNSTINIATFDPDDLLNFTSGIVRLSAADLAWERNVGAGRAGWGDFEEGQGVEEGSSVLIHDDKIYILYAGSTIDMHYCVGMLYANLGDNLMDANSWKKYPYPVLSTQDLTTTIKENDHFNYDYKGEYTGTFGPGHNSITVDEDGNPVIVYHARDWDDDYDLPAGSKYGLGDPGRHAYANSIHFGADGFPICNMTAEQQLSSELENVSIKLIVGLESITVTPPAKTSYSIGEAFNPAGMVVRANYSDGSNREVTGYTTDFNSGKAGSHIVTVNYNGKTATFGIMVEMPKKDISRGTIENLPPATYTGAAIVPGLTVKDGNLTLTEGKDYTKKVSNNVNAGTANVEITGTGGYYGSKKTTFVIRPKSVGGLKIRGNGKLTYTGKALKHKKLKVLDGKKVLSSGKDYVIKYSGNVNIGKGTISLSGKGNYTGSKTYAFKIIPAKVKGVQLRSPQTFQLYISWKKTKGRITGYEFIYAGKKNFKGSKKLNLKKTHVLLKKMKSGTKYYVKVRAYKKVKGIKYYGTFSGVKTFTAK